MLCHEDQTFVWILNSWICLLYLTTNRPGWRQFKRDISHPRSVKLLITLAAGDKVEHYTLMDGIIRFKGRVWIGSNEKVQQHILQAFHTSPVGGHSGFAVTYRRIKALFAWSALKQSVQSFVAGCSICQQAKAGRVKYLGLLQPLPVPNQAWQMVSMDFIEGLPRSKRYNCILVVVDKFSKLAHFIPLSHPFTALTVAQTYMEYVYKLHGLPTSIISDRDCIFTSRLWQELFRLSATTM
ncbi:hypothetical protein BS78_K102800 [Paspalum vaginatum]|uniref:Integrase catalytic domain-containing protein n=1 Tax=Paspalum vaginatum TaxID=158149 RepID=A0A9W8CFV8_9POAL|nr:hypothetical protein BS78_K102800 [Paspalum vaginatum]